MFGFRRSRGGELTHLPGDPENSIDALLDEYDDTEDLIDQAWEDTKREKANAFDFLSLAQRVRYYIPFLSWIREYQWSFLRKDILAGITVSVMMIPQTLAFANMLDVRTSLGLQSGFFPILIYFFFGTSKQVSMGSETVVCILTASLLDSTLGESDALKTLEEKEQLIEVRTLWASLIAGMVGLNLLILGIFRLGFLVQMFSRALLSGFINAVAIHIIIEQLGNITDIPTKGHSLELFKEVFHGMGHKRTVVPMIMGLCCLGFLVTIRILKSFQIRRLRWLQYVPDILLTVLVATLITHFTDIKKSVRILGPKRTGFLKPGFGGLEITMSQFIDVFPSTFSIAVIGMVESILVGQIYASKGNYRVSNNRELVAIGLANCIGCIFKIFPAFASLGRSAVNFQTGAKSQISSLVTGFIVCLSILFLLPYFENLPRVALAAVIINASLGIFEFEELVFLWKVRAWRDIGLFCFSFVATNIFGIESGISLTIAVSLLLLVKHTSFPHIAILQKSDNTNTNANANTNTEEYEEVAVIRDINLFEEAHDYSYEYVAHKGALILRIDEALYFANVGQVKELLSKLESNGNVQIRAIVIVANNIPFLDATAAHTFLELIEEWEHRKIVVCLVKPRLRVLNMMAKSGILQVLTKERIFTDIAPAMAYIEHRKSTYPLHPRDEEDDYLN